MVNFWSKDKEKFLYEKAKIQHLFFYLTPPPIAIFLFTNSTPTVLCHALWTVPHFHFVKKNVRGTWKSGDCVPGTHCRASAAIFPLSADMGQYCHYGQKTTANFALLWDVAKNRSDIFQNTRHIF